MTSKFIVVPENKIFLTDFVYWAENEEKLREWCELHNCEFAGMGINLPDEYTLTLFLLTWS